METHYTKFLYIGSVGFTINFSPKKEHIPEKNVGGLKNIKSPKNYMKTRVYNKLKKSTRTTPVCMELRNILVDKIEKMQARVRKKL